MPSKKPTILCRTSQEIKIKLENIAEKEKRSLSNLTEIIFEKYIEDYEKQHGTINIQNNINVGNNSNGNININQGNNNGNIQINQK